MCKITFKAIVMDSGNSPYEVGDEVLMNIKHKREAQLCYDFSDERAIEPMCEAEVSMQRLNIAGRS